jgi:predicted ATPase with chaperone activity
MTRTRHQIQTLSLEALLQQVRSLVSTTAITPEQYQQLMQVISAILQSCAQTTPPPPPARDMQEIRGNNQVKRALEVAAAGGHPILLVGPAGAGKALLARAVPSLLPTTAQPSPFREPSSNINWNNLVGDLTFPRTLSLAQGGVLFLKDLDTFDLPLLTSLAQSHGNTDGLHPSPRRVCDPSGSLSSSSNHETLSLWISRQSSKTMP